MHLGKMWHLLNFTPFWWVPEITPYFSSVSEFHKWIAGYYPNSPVAIKFDCEAYTMLITSFFLKINNKFVNCMF